MTILKLKSKKEVSNGDKLAGVYLPKQSHAYLALYTLSEGKAKAVLLRALIEDWIKTQQAKESEAELVEKIIYKVQVQWKVEKSLHHDVNLEDYKAELKRELQTRGLKANYIEIILNELKDAEDQTSGTTQCTDEA